MIGSCLPLLLLLLTTLSTVVSGYLVIVDESATPGTIIFNASVYKLGSDRYYKLNTHRSAHFVHHLLRVDEEGGQISLKKSLKCDGIYYPNLFTFYVDSTSNKLRSIDYYSLLLMLLLMMMKYFFSCLMRRNYYLSTAVERGQEMRLKQRNKK